MNDENRPQTAEEYRNAELTSDVAGSNEPLGSLSEADEVDTSAIEAWMEGIEKGEGQFEDCDLLEGSEASFDMVFGEPKGATDEEVREAIRGVEE